MRTGWSDYDFLFLTRRLFEGATQKQIAKELGRSKSSVACYIDRHRNKIGFKLKEPKTKKPRPLPKPSLEEVRAQLEQMEVVPDAPTFQLKYGIPFNELRSGQCRFILSERPVYNAPTCGEPSVLGCSWCAKHFLLCYSNRPIKWS